LANTVAEAMVLEAAEKEISSFLAIGVFT